MVCPFLVSRFVLSMRTNSYMRIWATLSIIIYRDCTKVVGYIDQQSLRGYPKLGARFVAKRYCEIVSEVIGRCQAFLTRSVIAAELVITIAFL
jgi:hypothetical protein